MNRTLALLLPLVLGATVAFAIPRDEALVRARTYAQHPWHCAAANLTGGCGGGYASVYTVGDYVGVAYDWGGYATLDQFDQGLDDGLGAGAQPSDGILDCTVGVDCSGFVSRVWKAAHTTTSGMSTITSPVTAAQLKPADAYNAAGYHVKLFERVQADGDPQFIEAVYYNVHTTFWETWADVVDYDPVRYDAIEDTPLTYADGTPDHPVPVTSFPFVDQRDTSLSASDLFDACLGAAPTKKEQGPEVVYAVEVDQPGTLTAAVQDDAGVDIDVHIYRALNEWDCAARDDKLVSLAVGCGTVYVVADSFTGSSGDQPGPYTLTLDFEPSGAGCGTPDPAYDFEGGVGAACDWDGSGTLPFCNPNLGAVVCVYSSEPGGGSFCSFPCAADADCSAAFPGGCCAELDVDYFACLTAEFCGGADPEPQPEPQPDLSAEALAEAEPEADVTEPIGPSEVVGETDTTSDPGAPADTAHDPGPAADGVDVPSPDAAEETHALADTTPGPDGSSTAGDTTGAEVSEPTAGGSGGCTVVASPAREASSLLLLVALLVLVVRRRRIPA